MSIKEIKGLIEAANSLDSKGYVKEADVIDSILEKIGKATLDPVGKEDADPNNNGVKNDKSDKYIMNRRKKISESIKAKTKAKTKTKAKAKAKAKAKVKK